MYLHLSERINTTFIDNLFFDMKKQINADEADKSKSIFKICHKSSVVVKAKSLHPTEKTGKVQDELPD